MKKEVGKGRRDGGGWEKTKRRWGNEGTGKGREGRMGAAGRRERSDGVMLDVGKGKKWVNG